MVALLLIVSLFAASWWFAPVIAASLLSRYAEAAGLTLEQVDIPRQSLPPWHIRHLQATEGQNRIEASDVWITPPPAGGRWHLEIRDIRVRTPPLQSAGPALTLDELRAYIAAGMQAFATEGKVKHISWCHGGPAECVDVAASWTTGLGSASVSVSPWNTTRGNYASFGMAGTGYGFSATYNRITLQGFGTWQAHGMLTLAGLAILPPRMGEKAPIVLAGDSPVPWQAKVTQLMLRGQAHFLKDVPLTPANIARHLELEADVQMTVSGAAELAGGTRLAMPSQAFDGRVSLYSPSSVVLNQPLTASIQPASGNALTASTGAHSQCIFKTVPLDVQCTLHNAKLAGLDFKGEALPIGADSLEIGGNAQHAKLASDTISVLGIPAVTLNAEATLPGVKGHLTGSWHGKLSAFAPLAKQFGLEDFTIHDGDLGLDWASDVDAAKPISQMLSATTLSAKARHMDITMSGYALIGGGFDMSLTGWPQLQTLRPAHMDWQEVNIGIPLTEVSSQFDASARPLDAKYDIAGKQLSARTLGGSITSDDFAIRLPAFNGHANVMVDSVQLDQVLALEKQRFESSGSISGSVPIQITDGKFSVEGGYLAANTPGGLIKVKRSAAIDNMVKDNTQMKTVIDALSDFRYKSLESRLDYSRDGKLVAHTALKGSNPSFENGREIHFNLQLEENIGTLLESLRLSDKVTRRIEDKINAGAATGK